MNKTNRQPTKQKTFAKDTFNKEANIQNIKRTHTTKQQQKSNSAIKE